MYLNSSSCVNENNTESVLRVFFSSGNIQRRVEILMNAQMFCGVCVHFSKSRIMNHTLKKVLMEETVVCYRTRRVETLNNLYSASLLSFSLRLNSQLISLSFLSFHKLEVLARASGPALARFER